MWSRFVSFLLLLLLQVPASLKSWRRSGKWRRGRECRRGRRERTTRGERGGGERSRRRSTQVWECTVTTSSRSTATTTRSSKLSATRPVGPSKKTAPHTERYAVLHTHTHHNFSIFPSSFDFFFYFFDFCAFFSVYIYARTLAKYCRAQINERRRRWCQITDNPSDLTWSTAVIDCMYVLAVRYRSERERKSLLVFLLFLYR